MWKAWCWSRPVRWTTSHEHGIGPDGSIYTFLQSEEFVLGSWHGCALVDGVARCWGPDIHGESSPPATEFAVLAAGTYHTCGATAAGALECWGADDYGATDVP